MNFVKTSFIPENKILIALVDKRITIDMKNKLNNLNINIIESSPCIETYDAISCHPDVTLLKINDNNIIVAPNVYDYYSEKLVPLGFNIIKGNSFIKNKYPYNIGYNVAIFGKYAIHNFKYTDKKILEFLDKNNFIKINVKQGYCKCSICIVDESSIITSDEGIYKEVMKHDIDCLLIEKGHIDLFDLNYGFIGGCSGLISKDDLMFFGDISKHPNYNEIKKFIESKNKNIISLSTEKLLDLGSLIPLI
ncbi:DUF6873 family GME fold protein [Terrisporobacter sp.]|uniref:DUF6873 family GME fold protein n=1 Tax=Terrisporobacter sp. TaxID=1965305 RepID=UPI00260D9B93|nr:hypothetical protein [Terrisporobacter sp.]